MVSPPRPIWRGPWCSLCADGPGFRICPNFRQNGEGLCILPAFILLDATESPTSRCPAVAPRQSLGAQGEAMTIQTPITTEVMQRSKGEAAVKLALV